MSINTYLFVTGQEAVDDVQELHDSFIETQIFTAFEEIDISVAVRATQRDLLGTSLGGQHCHVVVKLADGDGCVL